MNDTPLKDVTEAKVAKATRKTKAKTTKTETTSKAKVTVENAAETTPRKAKTTTPRKAKVTVEKATEKPEKAKVEKETKPEIALPDLSSVDYSCLDEEYDFRYYLKEMPDEMTPFTAPFLLSMLEQKLAKHDLIRLREGLLFGMLHFEFAKAVMRLHKAYPSLQNEIESMMYGKDNRYGFCRSEKPDGNLIWKELNTMLFFWKFLINKCSRADYSTKTKTAPTLLGMSNALKANPAMYSLNNNFDDLLAEVLKANGYQGKTQEVIVNGCLGVIDEHFMLAFSDLYIARPSIVNGLRDRIVRGQGDLKANTALLKWWIAAIEGCALLIRFRR